MARLTLILGVLATVVYLLDGFRFMLNEWRTWRNKSKWLVVLGLLLVPSMAEAACSGSGLTWTCTAGSTGANVQSAINSGTDGMTITFDAGTYDWTGSAQAKFSNSKATTLICATPPSSVGSATSNQCLITKANRPVFGSDALTGTISKAYRISGFTFDLNASTSGFGTIYWDSYNGGTGTATVTSVRVDHNTFQNGSNGAQTTLIASGGPPSQKMHLYGVYDHNYYTNATQMTAILWIGNFDGTFDSPFGTANNVFFEDNILDYTAVGNASAQGCTDGWGGMALVARHNSSRNCLWAAHGVQHSGGPANYEFYDNTIVMDAGSVSAGVQDCYRCFHHQGSGEIIAFNNIFTAYSGKASNAISVAHYRSFGGATPTQCDGNDVTLPDGNRTPIGTYRGYPCYHQPGRDFKTLTLHPMYAWNNRWSDTAAKIPLFVEDFVTPPDYILLHVAADRDYYNSVSKDAQTSNTSPFNGTTGMGFGTHISPDYRPTTCTPTSEALDAGNGGVGYFATDENILYLCTSTNTWTAIYTPYTYPHPLNVPEETVAPTVSVVVIARVLRWMEVAAFVTGMGWHFRKPLLAICLAAISLGGTLVQLAPKSYDTIKVVGKDSAVTALTVFNHLTKQRKP